MATWIDSGWPFVVGQGFVLGTKLVRDELLHEKNDQVVYIFEKTSNLVAFHKILIYFKD